MYPCTALLENYQPPDIARLDLAIPYRREDVSSDQIFTDYGFSPDNLPILQEALRDNVLWSWSRRPEEVLINEEVVKEIFNVAKRLERKYGNNNVPLVSQDIDKKIAKLSAGYAALRHSADASGECIVVKIEHVKHVEALVNKLYSSEGMRLHQYTTISKQRGELSQKEYSQIRQELEEMKKTEKIPIFDIIMKELLLRGSATLSEIEAMFIDEMRAKVSRNTILHRIAFFKKHRLLISTRRGYYPTPRGVSFFHRYCINCTQHTDSEEGYTIKDRNERGPLDNLFNTMNTTDYISTIERIEEYVKSHKEVGIIKASRDLGIPEDQIRSIVASSKIILVKEFTLTWIEEAE
jgi:hypothetical protein